MSIERKLDRIIELLEQQSPLGIKDVEFVPPILHTPQWQCTCGSLVMCPVHSAQRNIEDLDFTPNQGECLCHLSLTGGCPIHPLKYGESTVAGIHNG